MSLCGKPGGSGEREFGWRSFWAVRLPVLSAAAGLSCCGEDAQLPQEGEEVGATPALGDAAARKAEDDGRDRLVRDFTRDDDAQRFATR